MLRTIASSGLKSLNAIQKFVAVITDGRKQNWKLYYELYRMIGVEMQHDWCNGR